MKTHWVIAGCLGLVMMWSTSVQAQHFVWAKQLGGTLSDQGHSVTIDAVGNIYTTGWFQGTADFDPGPATFNLTTSGGYNVFVTKFTPAGNLIWAKHFEAGIDFNAGISVGVDAAGNAYITGNFWGAGDFDPGPATFNLTSAGDGDIFIAKLGPSGNFIWAKQFGGATDDYGVAIAVDAVGHVYATGLFEQTVDFDPGPSTFNLTAPIMDGSDVFIIKLDASGDLVWARQLSGGYNDIGNSIAIDAAGNVYATGYFQDTVSLQDNIFITKLDASGNLGWTMQFGEMAEDDHGNSIAVDAAGFVYVTGYFHGTVDFDPGPATFNLTAGWYDIFITKFDTSGNLVWAKKVGGSSDDFGHSIAVDVAGNVYTTGYFYGTVDFDPSPSSIFNLTGTGGGYDIFIAKLDTSGNLVWAKQFGGSGFDNGNSIAVDAAGNVYATGFFIGTADFDPGLDTFNLTSVNSDDIFICRWAQNPPFVIEGNFFADTNANCIPDTSEISLSGFLVKAEPNALYGISDSAGNYKVNLFDTGSYTISIATADTIWQPICTTSYSVQLSGTPDTTGGINFAMQPAYYCQRLITELGVPLLRRCFNNTYTIRYGNTGSLPVSNAYIEVDFGNNLQLQNSTLPWSSVSGNVYTFSIGNLNIYQQGSFNVTALLDCAAPLGSTQCVTAHIYPDSSCFSPPIGWDKSETKVTGTCVNDSLVCFTIKNRSSPPSGNMQGPAPWRLYVNDTLITQGTYQLAGRDSLIKCYPANGKTFRLEADQRLGHPGNSNPKAIVEACGSPANFGFVNTVAQDDKDLFVETFCMVVRGSYDPNDKQVSPAGITSNQYIIADDELEYLIRFQNTGTDTAFRVVILDTIATDVLDIATLTSGASSHDYTFNIYGHGIAEWTFDNILLPDSNVNEPASHGFVQFKIKQLPGNPDGTRIENRAAIYFDFNAPVITNTAWNVVNEAALPESFLTAINSATDITCQGDSNGTASVSASGGLAPYQYLWSDSTTTATATDLDAGNYFVTITDATGTALADTVSIAEPSLLSAIIDSVTHVLCHGDGTGSATATSTGGTPPYSYEWSNQGSEFATANFLNAGVYWVTVWDANLCTVTTSSVTITEPPQLTASISTQSRVRCFGGNDASAKAIALGGVAPYDFEWSNGNTSSTVDNLSAGDYQITVTDSNSCWLVTSITINDGYQINTGGISGADTAHVNQTATYSVNAGFSYSWSVTNGTIVTGQSTNSIEVDWNTTGQGTLEVIVTDSGCTQTVSKSITIVDATGIHQTGLNNIQLYPNPTNGTLTVTEMPSLGGMASLSFKLSDALGRTVWQQTAQPQELQNGLVIDMKEMHSGIFLLNIQSERTNGVMKVVKY